MSKLVKIWSFYSELLSNYGGSMILLPIMTFIAWALAYLLYRVTNRKKFYKYIPGLIFSAVGIYYLVNGLSNIVTQQGLDSIWDFCVYFVAGFNGLMFAWILGIYNKQKKRKRDEVYYEVSEEAYDPTPPEEVYQDDFSAIEEEPAKETRAVPTYDLSEENTEQATKAIPRIDKEIMGIKPEEKEDGKDV